MQCPKPDCMYLHELGDEAASFTKEEMQVNYWSLDDEIWLYSHKILRLWRIHVQGSFNLCCLSLFRRENIKNTSRSSSKTSIKLTLAFYNLLHVEQRRQKIKPTPHKGTFDFPLVVTC